MKRLFKFLLILLVFLLVVGSCSYGVYRYKVSQSGSLNIVIIGIDAREGEDVSRSDSLMIAHIDDEHRNVNLISIPRDSLVYIPAVEREDKITHAYAFAQKEGTLKTLSSLFETDFEYYIEVDFEKMIALVDSIDGITLTPTATFCEMDEKDNEQTYCFEEGVEKHMNGAEALSYSRHRKSDSDLFRAQRQQEVVKAMISKVKKSNLVGIYQFYKDVESISNTNLSFFQLVGYLDMAFNDFEVKQEVAEGYSDTTFSEYYGQYLSFFFLDTDWVNQKIQQFNK